MKIKNSNEKRLLQATKRIAIVGPHAQLPSHKVIQSTLDGVRR
ncbi:MAG: hypothetical protein WCE50_12155 [Candidatus Acidiferrum sp.]